MPQLVLYIALSYRTSTISINDLVGVSTRLPNWLPDQKYYCDSTLGSLVFMQGFLML